MNSKHRDKRGTRMKATIEIERDLWKRVRRAALDEDRQAWRIVTEALEAYLAKKKGGAK